MNFTINANVDLSKFVTEQVTDYLAKNEVGVGETIIADEEEGDIISLKLETIEHFINGTVDDGEPFLSYLFEAEGEMSIKELMELEKEFPEGE